jgi:guanylate kinase
MNKLIILTGPSGSGKTTLAQALLGALHRKKVVTHTTRTRRPGEVDGVDYNFVTVDEFTALIDSGVMLEWAGVYGNMYGTSQDALQQVFATGCDAVAVVDIQGALWWQENYKGWKLIIFITPPDPNILRVRLESRGDTGDTLLGRLETSAMEAKYLHAFDYFVINDDLVAAIQDLEEIIG